ncbi:MAG: polysaccharide deacetylase family protein [Deltaproteobacteria bacterium]|nr:polysaccharide deacetylase family protein [Deltaproteobacteria bacterium]MBI3386615.1 polysaccharide deacetylase family protein [Deltaproteobacteria bacterium]
MPIEPLTPSAIRHALSVDVEDWYHDAASNVRAPYEQRVEANTLRLLDLFAEHDARATFFVLGEVAAQYPGLIRRIAAAGHEIGSHGYRHCRVPQLLRREFRDDVAHSLRVLEDLTGRRVGGYRAPYFSIKADVQWPIDTLRELGIAYDSSILAIDRPPGLELVCPRTPFRHRNGLWEVPVGVLRMLYFWHLPLASGAGLRMVPTRLLWRCVERFERDVGAGVFYLHPWELDPASPASPGAAGWFLRAGRRRLPERLRALLRARAFAPIGEVFPDCNAAVTA